MAALVNEVISDLDLQDQVLDAQDAALARLVGQDFGAMVTRFVEEVLARPRKPQAVVAFDFWRQFQLAAELEEIRETRPAAFRALPPETDESGPIADLGHGR